MLFFVPSVDSERVRDLLSEMEKFQVNSQQLWYGAIEPSKMAPVINIRLTIAITELAFHGWHQTGYEGNSKAWIKN